MENLIIYTLAATLFMVFLSYPSYASKDMEDRSNIHFNSIVVDGHNDTMMKVIDENTWLPKVNIGNNTDNHIDIQKLKKGGLNAPFFAAYTQGYYGNNPRSISRTLSLINALYWTEKENEDTFKISTCVREIEKFTRDGKIAAVPTIEGGYSLNKDNYMGLIRQYYDLGVRVLGFTWNYSNELGEGASGTYGDTSHTTSPKGLTDLGKELVGEMNKLGMVVDVSHMSESTFWDVIEVTNSPIIASHSGVFSLKKHPRNLTDRQLKALKENRGVIGIVLYPKFLTDSKNTYIKDYVDHIDYAVKLIGIDHVGIGSDFDGAQMPRDLKDASEMYKITDELIKRGYREEDIDKILGKNMLRVLKENEEKAEYARRNLCFQIIPELKMGDRVIETTPNLKAKIEGDNELVIDGATGKVIVDGISYDAKYDVKTSTLYHKLQRPLEEKFHVVTFEISDDKGRIQRQTRIFYIDITK
ncbi:MAG: dipeptidase [Tissierellaceae bacterium]